jgi:hypothetical protein
VRNDDGKTDQFFYEDSHNPVQVDVRLNIFKYEVLNLSYLQRDTRHPANSQWSRLSFSQGYAALGVSVVFFSLYLIWLKIMVFFA